MLYFSLSSGISEKGKTHIIDKKMLQSRDVWPLKCQMSLAGTNHTVQLTMM